MKPHLKIFLSFWIGVTIGWIVFMNLDIGHLKHVKSSISTVEKSHTSTIEKWDTGVESNVTTVFIKETKVKFSSEIKDFQDVHVKDNVEGFKTDEYWEMSPHYNIDDYGVPIEEYVLSVENMNSITPLERVQKFKARGIKTVLYMHTAYGSKTYGFNSDKDSEQGQRPYIMKGCRRRDCFCTDKRNFIPIEDFDAIVFYSRGVADSDRPAVRKPHQRYILWEVEPPLYLMSFRPDRWNNFFNWTHTYRRDSDFWEPWGMVNQFKPYPKPIDELIKESSLNTEFTGTKKKSVAWLVSNCSPRSGRNTFIRELQKYIDVDVYGRCGTMQCGRGPECWQKLESEYFFYFAAENSLCKDYITEKFFNTFRYKVIPISFGGGQDTNDYYFMPKKSYINAFDYQTPKELADFLIKLKSDVNEYSSYFWWKPYYRTWLGRWKKAHCEICDQLHENKVSQTYKDIKDWWVTQSKCRPAWNG